MKIARDFNGDLTIGSLNNAKVGGLVTGARWDVNGDIGTVTVGGLHNSSIFAGIRDDVTGLPDSADEFETQQAIGKLTVKGVRGQPFAFVNANVAAYALGTIQLRDPQTANGGTPFGVAAHSLKSFSLQQGATRFRWNDRLDPSLLVPVGDFVVRLT
jgi:hypothetical protein